ncbi:hypothetical protein V6N12_012549 [Hibiscus sabdariffa]|uniref:FBD domain-containing protein n=1 Tax=Hibiscus sabdariffa TaxID=183260 RepID=A0ABR2B5H4_9ROSI
MSSPKSNLEGCIEAICSSYSSGSRLPRRDQSQVPLLVTQSATHEGREASERRQAEINLSSLSSQWSYQKSVLGPSRISQLIHSFNSSQMLDSHVQKPRTNSFFDAKRQHFSPPILGFEDTNPETIIIRRIGAPFRRQSPPPLPTVSDLHSASSSRFSNVFSEAKQKLASSSLKSKAENSPLPVADHQIGLLFSNPDHLRLECVRGNDRLLGAGYLSIYDWLCAASRRGVKEIDLSLYNIAIWKLPTLLFACPSLVTLKLDVTGSDMEVPTNVSLPNLKTLHLSKMQIKDGCSFLRLISGCPVLEDLGLFGCFLIGTSELNIHSLSLKRLVLDSEMWVDMTSHSASSDFDWMIVIDAPSLAYFEYFCFVCRGYALRNMESLEKADITICLREDVDRERSAALLQGIRNVRVLHFSIHDFDAPLSRMRLDSGLVFHNLVELDFENHCDDCNLSLTWIVEFLHRVPNLKTLILDLIVADRVFESLPEEVPSCLLYHLKEVSIVSFRGDTRMFEIVSYFLNHASVLEKLVMRSIDVPQEFLSTIYNVFSETKSKLANSILKSKAEISPFPVAEHQIGL